MKMNNNDKLEFIKANYKSARTFQLLPKDQRTDFYNDWIKLIKESTPLNLYKYRECNENNLNALKSRKAWFSNPSTWNDPIDVTVQYNIEKDIQLLDKNFDNYVLKFAFTFINKYIDSFCEQKKFVTADEVKEVYYSSFKDSDKFDPNRMVSYLTPIVGDKPARQITVKTQEAFSKVFTPEFKEEIIGNLKNFFGFNDIKDKCIMYSLSETHTNNHQWAMYADGGKGFCIGYEIQPKNERELSLLAELLPIYYGEKKELLITKMLDECLEYSIRPETLDDLMNQESENLFVSFHTKTIEWNGEQEWRFSLPIENATGTLIDFDFAKSIYLGEKISAEWKDKLIAIAKELSLSVYQRKLDRMKSNWCYEKLNLTE